nr:uncharacterized protein LOC123750850 [Procambarus clarkii]
MRHRIAGEHPEENPSQELKEHTILPREPPPPDNAHYPHPGPLSRIPAASLHKTQHWLPQPLQGNVASRGDDNNLTTYYHSQPGLVYPWWVLDLGNTHIIHHINILPRPGYYSFRFHNIEVRVGNIREESGKFSSFSLFSTYVGPYSDTMGNLSCYRRDGVTGRYISVQRVTPEDDMLQISDVRVFVLIQ